MERMCVYFQGDGREEVVACAWDGQTYIIDHNRTVVRFQFDENVNAFCAGESEYNIIERVNIGLVFTRLTPISLQMSDTVAL